MLGSHMAITFTVCQVVDKEKAHFDDYFISSWITELLFCKVVNLGLKIVSLDKQTSEMKQLH